MVKPMLATRPSTPRAGIPAWIVMIGVIANPKKSIPSTKAGRKITRSTRKSRQAWKQYGLMWLILKGIDLVWPLVMIPFALLSGGLALLMGGGFTFLTGGNAIQSGDPAMVWPIVGGIILVIILLMVPLAFLAGLRETFQSTSWTLAYRELKAQGLLDEGNGGALLLAEDEAEAEA